jgi:hypothetical protein
MSAASDFIEEIERRTKERIESNNGDNFAIIGVLGAISREMGASPPSYSKEQDIAAGLLIQRKSSPEGLREQRAKEIMADLLVAGVDPKTASILSGK